MEDLDGPSMGTPIYYVGLACSLVLWVLCPRAPQSARAPCSVAPSFLAREHREHLCT